jgi:hypothetical protein
MNTLEQLFYIHVQINLLKITRKCKNNNSFKTNKNNEIPRNVKKLNHKFLTIPSLSLAKLFY